MHNAYLCKDSGEIFYTSEMGDSDELPEDIDDSDKYISIPHQNELELGQRLVFEFVSEYLPDESGQVNAMFRSRGAYSRYKNLLDKKGLLDNWHRFEDERKREALRQWCLENDINLDG